MPGDNEKNYIIRIVIEEQAMKDSVEKIKDEVEDLGDQAKKTGKDVEDGLGGGFDGAADKSKKSSNIFKDIFSKVKNGISNLLPSFTKLQKTAADAAKPMSLGMAALIGGVAGAAGAAAFKAIGSGFAFIRDNIRGVIDESTKNETALNALNTSLALTGKYSETASKKLFDMSEAMSDVSNSGGDEILQAMSKIQAMGNLSLEQLGKSTQAAIDLAAGTGMSFESAAAVIAKASNGNMSSLNKMGVVIDTSKTKAEQFEEALDKVGAKFGGAGFAATMDFSGTVKQLNNSIGDFQKNLGDLVTKNPAVLAGIQTVAQLFRDLSKAVKDNNGSLNTFITGAVSTFVKVFTGVIDMTINAVQRFNDLKLGVKALSTFFVTAVDAMVTSARELWNRSDKEEVARLKKGFEARLEARRNELDADIVSHKERNEELNKYYQSTEKIRNNYSENLKKQQARTNSEILKINENSRADELAAEESTREIAKADELEFLAWKKSSYDTHFAQLREAYGDDYAVWFDAEMQKMEAAKNFEQLVSEMKQSERDLEMANILSFTKWEKLNWKQRLNNTTSTLESLSALQNSQTLEMFRVGQAAAAANSAISTAQGAIAAYTSLAGIPIVGPALGAAAAAALIVFGVEQQKQIWSQKPPIARAHKGGLVGGNVPFGGDMGQVRVERLERIITPEQNSVFEKLVFGSDNLVETLAKMNAFMSQNNLQTAGVASIYMDGDKVNESLEEAQNRRLK